MTVDLFGEAIKVPETSKRKTTLPRGHAAPPGSGPAGETCKSCAHYTRRRYSKAYLKCGLMRENWTGGPGSDIRAKDPACRMWEKQDA